MGGWSEFRGRPREWGADGSLRRDDKVQFEHAELGVSVGHSDYTRVAGGAMLEFLGIQEALKMRGWGGPGEHVA